MKRRDFIQLTAIGGSLPLISLSACAPGDEENKEEKVASASFELEETSVAELRTAMEEGRYTSADICQLYIDRINKVDQVEDGLNSVIELNPDALSIAKSLDDERASGKVRGPLHGIPVMIKDNIDTADKMMTTAGALALVGNVASKDSFIVRKLREAGVVLLGKTNLSEWANFRSTRSSSGWSGRGRQTRNPYALDRNPCGSSSGSGVAVSANLCAITIGTETNGSIVCPASTNGVVGIKPTVGLWSRTGIIPISVTQDTAGPMARNVADAASLLGPLTGIDPQDPHTEASNGNSFTDYTQFLNPKGLEGKRIGVLRNYFGFHEKVDEIMEDSLNKMKDAGAILIDPVEYPSKSKFGRSSYDLLLYEFKDGVNKYLSSANAKVKTLKEVIEFNKANEEQSMPYFMQEILESAEEKGGLEEQEYKDILAKVLKLSQEEGLDVTFGENNLDAVVAPTRAPAWPIDVINGDHSYGGSSSPAARAGYPSITVPAGYIYGLPIGISFSGKAYTEPTLIEIAYAYEQITKARITPTMPRTLKLP